MKAGSDNTAFGDINVLYFGITQIARFQGCFPQQCWITHDAFLSVSMSDIDGELQKLTNRRPGLSEAINEAIIGKASLPGKYRCYFQHLLFGNTCVHKSHIKGVK